MKTLNRAMLIGHLAADPELRETKSGKTVCSFALATNRFLKSDGEKQEIADFHKIIAWGKLGEICAEHLSKGMAVYVDGRIINRSFEDKDGKRHYVTEIVLDGLNMLTSKKSGVGEQKVEVKAMPGMVAA